MTEQRVTRVFWKIYAAAAQKPRCISNRGSARSSKTYSCLQFLHMLIPAADTVGNVTSVVSETVPHLKRGAIRDFESILGHPLSTDPHWNATDNIYTYPNGAKLEFFSADSPDKVLGPQRKRLFVNECNHISYDTFRQLAVRTSGLILLDYNPTSLFWAIEKIETRPTTIYIHSTYKDNDFLSAAQIAEIESNRNDPNWWRVYGEGKLGQLEGVIYDFEQIDTMPEKSDGMIETYGLDFGFTNDPTTCGRFLIHTGRREIFADELFYRTGMLNRDIIAELKANDVPLRRVPIYADCAEPKSIAEIAQAGFNVLPCYKATRITEQIAHLKQYKLYVTKRSLEAIRELREYTWAKDKDGRMLNQPRQGFDHFMDAMRYGCFSPLSEFAKQEHYRITIR